MTEISVIITKISTTRVKLDFAKSPNPSELPMPPEHWETKK